MVPSLRWQLQIRLLVPMLALMLGSGVFFYVLALHLAQHIYDQWLVDSARTLAQQVRVVGGHAVFELSPTALDLVLWDESDRVVFRIDSERDGMLAGYRELGVPPHEPDHAHFHTAHVGGQDMRLVVVPLTDLKVDDTVYVTAAETLNKRERFAERALLSVLLPQALLIGVAILVVRSGIRRSLGSIQTLESAVHARQPGELTPLPQTEVPAELRPFTDAINGLIERLALALGAQQRFIADAAHQLRTPLAALKVQIERAIREPDPAERLDALERVREGIERTGRLSNQLLLLARAEPGAQPSARFKRVDLHALAVEVGALWVPRALSLGADLGFEGEEAAAWVEGDELLLGEVLNNLIDNALRYGGAGVQITVRVSEQADMVRLTVEDNGPGVPATEQDAILERFHRVPGSPAGGSGLGLAIVREIARAHGAALALTVPATGGVCVSLDFARVA